MKTAYIETSLAGTATRSQSRYDLWQWISAGSDPERGLHDGTNSAAQFCGYRVLDAMARSADRPCREAFDGRYAEVASQAAALAIRLESSVFTFDTRHIPTVTDRNEIKARHTIVEAAAQHTELAALNPHAAMLLAEASQLLPCDYQMQVYASRTALSTLAVMGLFWRDRADIIADEIWLTGQFEELPSDV